MLIIALMFPRRFRWIFCQLEVLRQCFPSSVRSILAELPESLDETYERILQQIPRSNREHTHRLLQCLTVAMRPLRAQELAEVLAIDFSAPGTPLVEKLRWEDKERAVLSACSSLIAIVQDEYSGSRHVQFSHFSVKEFLTSDRLATSIVDTLRYHHIHLESAHTIMAQACLSVLLRMDSSMDKETIEGYPLARYAGQHFGDHVEFENVLPHVAEGVDNLLDPGKPHFEVWIWLRIDDWKPSAWHNSELDEKYVTPVSSPGIPSPPLIPTYPPRVSPLYYIAAFGHFSLTHRLVSKCPQYLHAQDDKFCTPLHIAVLAGQVEVSQLLIEHSINLDIRDIDNWTLLHMAAYKGLFEVSQILLERYETIKACLNMQNKKGRTALHLASRYHHFSIVRLLLKFGADVQVQDHYNMTPLHLAILGTLDPIEDGRTSAITQLLVAHGASVDIWNKSNWTPLHFASLREVPSTMASLLKFGADVDSRNDDNMTPLHLLLKNQWPSKGEDRMVSCARLLLEHGASVHAQNKTGQTALHIASQSHITQIVPLLLLKLGADVNAKDNDNMTPLHLVLMEARTLYINDEGVRLAQSTVAQMLLEHGASVHMRNKDGQTPLHLASQNRFSSIVALLLKLGAEVDVRDNDNTTPLLLAPKMETFRVDSLHDNDAERGETARLLLVHGANVNVRDKNGQTPLHLVSERHFPTFLAILLKFGADVNAQDDDNMTPLHVAISSSSPELQPWEVLGGYSQAESDDLKVEVIRLLLEHGANIRMQNRRGETALQVAAARGEQKVVQILSEYMQNDNTI